MQVRIEGIMEKVDNANLEITIKIYELDKRYLKQRKEFLLAMVSLN